MPPSLGSEAGATGERGALLLELRIARALERAAMALGLAPGGFGRGLRATGDAMMGGEV